MGSQVARRDKNPGFQCAGILAGLLSHYLAGGVEQDRWEYEPIGRHIQISGGNSLTWMEEKLNSPSWLM